MPLLFLITYIVISYFMYKKNKNKLKEIPFIIKLNWVVAFALLFVFLVYYSEQRPDSLELFAKSFYFLLITYLVTFIVYLFKYKEVIKKSKLKIDDNKWNIEKVINVFYFIALIFLSGLYFFLSDKKDLIWDDGLQILMYMFFILSGFYVLLEKHILWIKQVK